MQLCLDGAMHGISPQRISVRLQKSLVLMTSVSSIRNQGACSSKISSNSITFRALGWSVEPLPEA